MPTDELLESTSDLLRGEEGCWNEINTLQRFLEHFRPKPHWTSTIADILNNLNQALITQFISNPILADQVRAEAGKNVIAAAGRLSATLIESTQDPVPVVQLPPQDPFGHSNIDPECGTGINWAKEFLKRHPIKHIPQFPDEIAGLLHSINEALAMSFIVNTRLAKEVRVEAGKHLVEAANKFASAVKTKTVTAA